MSTPKTQTTTTTTSKEQNMTTAKAKPKAQPTPKAQAQAQAKPTPKATPFTAPDPHGNRPPTPAETATLLARGKLSWYRHRSNTIPNWLEYGDWALDVSEEPPVWEERVVFYGRYGIDDGNAARLDRAFSLDD